MPACCLDVNKPCSRLQQRRVCRALPAAGTHPDATRSAAAIPPRNAHCGPAPAALPTGCSPGCLTVNIGDAFTRWTDGVLKSTYHRVRAPREGDYTVRGGPCVGGGAGVQVGAVHLRGGNPPPSPRCQRPRRLGRPGDRGRCIIAPPLLLLLHFRAPATRSPTL